MGGILHRTIKIFLKPVKMVLEGLKYKKLTYETITRARDITFAKYRPIS